jgi:predicted DNA-binding transcriptional regulator AlpA
MDTIPLVPPAAAAIEPGDLLTTKEAARLLGIEPRTLENWRWAKRGPRPRKIGTRCVRYLRADLVNFIEDMDAA